MRSALKEGKKPGIARHFYGPFFILPAYSRLDLQCCPTRKYVIQQVSRKLPRDLVDGIIEVGVFSLCQVGDVQQHSAEIRFVAVAQGEGVALVPPGALVRNWEGYVLACRT